MKRKIMRCGNSRAVRLTKEDRDHLGVDAEVQIHYTPNAIILTKPQGFDEVLERAQKRLTKLVGPIGSAEPTKDLGAFLKSGEFRRTILEAVAPAIQADERAVASSCVDSNTQRAL